MAAASGAHSQVIGLQASHRGLAGITFLSGLGINMVWELAQMHAYGPRPQPMLRAVSICALAALGDALYIALLYELGRWITGDPTWILNLTRRRSLFILIAGMFSAVILERLALAFDLWRYDAAMIKIPLLGVGLWPVLQLMLLPAGIFFGLRYFVHHPQNQAKLWTFF